jgi:glycine/D-amino acid oxidase-like deaminating enzyme
MHAPTADSGADRVGYTLDLPAAVMDYCVVGAGMTGCSFAYHVSKLPGKTCVVLEAREVAGGASGRNGGISHPHQSGPDSEFEQRTAASLKDFIEGEMGGADRACYLEGLGANLTETDCRQPPEMCFDPALEMGASAHAFVYGVKDPKVASFWPAKVT